MKTMLFKQPFIHVVGGTPADRALVAYALQRKTIRSVACLDAQYVINVADPPPSLILLIAPPDPAALARNIRAVGGWRESVPILACARQPIAIPAGCDGALPVDVSPDALELLVDDWMPPDPLAGARRLEAQFGQDKIAALVERLRRELAEAVRLLDDSGAFYHAHTIAGVAGTLGFGAVSEAWRRLSEGEIDATADARRTARIAIAAIDRLEK